MNTQQTVDVLNAILKPIYNNVNGFKKTKKQSVSIRSARETNKGVLYIGLNSNDKRLVIFNNMYFYF